MNLSLDSLDLWELVNKNHNLFMFNSDEDQTLEDDFLCSKCNNLLLNPITAKCRHHFCEKCIQDILNSQNKNCPIDQKPIESYVENNVLKKLVSKQKLKCPSHNYGCIWNGKVGDLENHYNLNCEFQLMYCNLNCKTFLPKNKIEFHISNECEERVINCQHCNLSMTFKEMENHTKNDCLKMKIECPNKCAQISNIEFIERENMKNHLEICLLEALFCPILNCNLSIPRLHMEEHLKENIFTHFCAINNMIENNYKEIKSNFEIQLQKFQEENLGMKSKINSLEEEKESLKTELFDLKQRLYEFSELNNSIVAENKQINNNFNQLREEHNQMERKIDRILLDLENTKNTIKIIPTKVLEFNGSGGWNNGLTSDQAFYPPFNLKFKILNFPTGANSWGGLIGVSSKKTTYEMIKKSFYNTDFMWMINIKEGRKVFNSGSGTEFLKLSTVYESMDLKMDKDGNVYVKPNILNEFKLLFSGLNPDIAYYPCVTLANPGLIEVWTN